jgi:hypothetical protein
VQIEKLGRVVAPKRLIEAPTTIVLAHVIIDLITIYDDDSDDVDTSVVPILNESNIEEKVNTTPKRPSKIPEEKR